MVYRTHYHLHPTKYDERLRNSHEISTARLLSKKLIQYHTIEVQKLHMFVFLFWNPADLYYDQFYLVAVASTVCVNICMLWKYSAVRERLISVGAG